MPVRLAIPPHSSLLCLSLMVVTACADSSGQESTAADSLGSAEDTSSSTGETGGSAAEASGAQDQETEASAGTGSGESSGGVTETEATSAETSESAAEAESEGVESTTGGGDLCGERTDGALIEFELKNPTLENPDRRETWRLWLTNSEFIDRAIEHLGSQTRESAVFYTFIDGRDCDEQWSFTMDSERVAWGEPQVGDDGGDTGSIPTDSCNGLPGDVEGQKDYWFSQVQILCPADVGVLAVDDRRP